MRRRDRNIVNGALIGGGVFVIGDILKQWIAKKQLGEKLTWDNFDFLQASKSALMGASIGGVGGYLYYSIKINEERKLPFVADDYLDNILVSERIKNDPTYFRAVVAKREILRSWLTRKFGYSLSGGKAIDGGSFAKRTANSSNYDIDIIVPFKKESYATLEEMYFDVYYSIRKQFGEKAEVKKRRKTISVKFPFGEDEIHFDIVPGREVKNFLYDKELHLYVRPAYLWEQGGYSKSNIYKHRKLTINKPDVRKAIRLLKIYRDRNEFELPTIIIDQSVADAMSERNFGVSYSLTENLLNCMDMLAQRLRQKRLLDIANSNNDLNKKLTYDSRIYLADQLLNDIERVESDPRYLKEMFDL